jgi:hypothetical protein
MTKAHLPAMAGDAHNPLHDAQWNLAVLNALEEASAG